MVIQTVREKMKITEHDALTNITIDRDMTDAEIQEFENRQIQVATAQAEVEAKATAKAALLTQLGITEEQAKLLLS